MLADMSVECQRIMRMHAQKDPFHAFQHAHSPSGSFGCVSVSDSPCMSIRDSMLNTMAFLERYWAADASGSHARLFGVVGDNGPVQKGGREEGRKGGREEGREEGRKGGMEEGRKGRREKEREWKGYTNT